MVLLKFRQISTLYDCDIWDPISILPKIIVTIWFSLLPFGTYMGQTKLYILYDTTLLLKKNKRNPKKHGNQTPHLQSPYPFLPHRPHKCKLNNSLSLLSVEYISSIIHSIIHLSNLLTIYWNSWFVKSGQCFRLHLQHLRANRKYSLRRYYF